MRHVRAQPGLVCGLGHGVELDVGVERVHRRLGRLHLGPAHAGCAVGHLALQVGELDLIGVDDGDAADASTRQVEQGGCTEATGTDHQGM